MRLRISQDARPQATTLLIATGISILLWFIPYVEFLTYPFRIFVTFIHEGGHALAALLTGNSVSYLSVAPNASGETYSTYGGIISQTLISSAGYVGSMAFGALLLVLIRKAVAARLVLLGCSIFVLPSRHEPLGIQTGNRHQPAVGQVGWRLVHGGLVL